MSLGLLPLYYSSSQTRRQESQRCLRLGRGVVGTCSTRQPQDKLPYPALPCPGEALQPPFRIDGTSEPLRD